MDSVPSRSQRPMAAMAEFFAPMLGAAFLARSRAAS